MITITNNDLSKVIDPKKTVVQYYSTTWCGPCKNIKPKIYALAEKYPDVNFALVDAEENMELSQQYSIMNVPTVILIKAGSVAYLRLVGSQIDTLENHLKNELV
jgi:thioredoxin 1